MKDQPRNCEYVGCMVRSVVGLQNRWYCLYHFEQELRTVSRNLVELRDRVFPPELATIPKGGA